MHLIADQPKYCPNCFAAYRHNFARCPADGGELEPCHRDPLIGTTIANTYVIEEFLGEGATARVYRCHHARLPSRRYALKLLLGDLALDPTKRARFGQEAEIASRLNHPHVVSVIDFGESMGGLLYIVMELVTGLTLSEHVRAVGRMEEFDAMLVARALARGLAHAHQHGLIHRDFKPDNIALLEPDGSAFVPRILDFGLAMCRFKDPTSTRLTKTGAVVGTPAYASPEQICDNALDHRSDLFALGMVMYEMLSGVLPFTGGLMEVIVAKTTQPPPRFDERVPGLIVSADLEALVLRLIAKDPCERFQSADEVKLALDKLLHMGGAVIPPAELTPPPRLHRVTLEEDSGRSSARLDARPTTPFSTEDALDALYDDTERQPRHRSVGALFAMMGAIVAVAIVCLAALS